MAEKFWLERKTFCNSKMRGPRRIKDEEILVHNKQGSERPATPSSTTSETKRGFERSHTRRCHRSPGAYYYKEQWPCPAVCQLEDAIKNLILEDERGIWPVASSRPVASSGGSFLHTGLDFFFFFGRMVKIKGAR